MKNKAKSNKNNPLSVASQEKQAAPLKLLNLTESISKALQLSIKLTAVWTSGDLKVVEGLQKLVFPEGIYYNKEKHSFRTPKANSIF